MRILTRYVGSNLIRSTALVILVLIAVEGLLEFIGQMSDIGVAQYSMWDAFLFSLMQLPAELYQLFPMAGFLGCLLGLGQLASTSQLLVMRASGVSKSRVAWTVVKTALTMMFFVMIIGEGVAPMLQLSAQQMKAAEMVQVKKLQDIWLRNGEQYVHFGEVVNPLTINQVELFMIDQQHNLLSAAYAPRAIYQNNHWVMQQVKQTLFGKDKVSARHFAALPLNVIFKTSAYQNEDDEVQQYSIMDLIKTIHYRKRAGLNVVSYQFSLWQRLMKPIMAIVMICLGVPFIFGSLRSASMGLRVLTGVMVGFAFYLSNQFFGPIAMIYQVPPLLAAGLPTVIFAVACVILLRRTV